MNFNFTPSLWANNGQPLPGQSCAPAGPGSPSSAQPGSSYGAYPSYEPPVSQQQVQSRMGALGQSFIHLQGAQAFQPASAAGGLAAPPYNNSNISSSFMGPASAFLDVSGVNHNQGQGGSFYQQPTSARASQPGYDSYGGVGNAYGVQPYASSISAPAGNSNGSASAAPPAVRPAAGISYGVAASAYSGNLMVGCTGLTGNQLLPQRRPQPGSEQVYRSALEFNGQALATKPQQDEQTPLRRKVYPQQFEQNIKATPAGLTPTYEPPQPSAISSPKAGQAGSAGGGLGVFSNQADASPAGKRMYLNVNNHASQLQADALTGFMLPSPSAVVAPVVGSGISPPCGNAMMRDHLQKAPTGITAVEDPNSRASVQQRGRVPAAGAAQSANIQQTEYGLMRAGEDPAKLSRFQEQAKRMMGSVLQSHPTGFAPPGDMSLYHMRHAAPGASAVASHLHFGIGGFGPTSTGSFGAAAGQDNSNGGSGSNGNGSDNKQLGGPDAESFSGVRGHQDKFKSQINFTEGGLTSEEELPVRKMAVGKQWSTTYDSHYLK